MHRLPIDKSLRTVGLRRQACGLLALLGVWGSAPAGSISQSPLYLGLSSPPLIMLTMERDHKLYYEAYNDASDVNGDGVLDVRYNPNLPDPADPSKVVDYYGYFDSHKCYSYSSGLFQPASTTTTKKCSGSWSGDFLNYLTTSRMDALRRVLYGGYRQTDTTSSTILERSYIPQDAHSWGKEYTSTAVDGYNIAEYAPLSQPASGKRHLFANTTLLCPSVPFPPGAPPDPGCGANQGLPLLRVLTDTSYRVWEWLSIERPVAGVDCATGNNSRAPCIGANSQDNSHPGDHTAFVSLLDRFANAQHRYGQTSPSYIFGSGNPSGPSDYYITVFTATLTTTATPPNNTYGFAVDGDDAVEVLVDGTVVAGWYGAHGKCNCTSHNGTITLSPGTHTVVFHHEEVTGDDNYYLYWKRPNQSSYEQVPQLGGNGGLSSITQTTYDRNVASTMTDYVVRVRACVDNLLESECRGYPSDEPNRYKPVGILQDYGSSDQMAFGLLTGSYAKNTSGGVLRKNVSSFTDEIDRDTGRFTATNGIVKTIDKLKTIGFGGNYFYNQNCTVPEVGGPLAEGRCRMWGNPLAEMMYESLRYLAGKTTPTSLYSIGAAGNDDASLSLPLPQWVNPYGATSVSPAGGGFPQCSKPSLLVISDINPNYDTDQLPGQHSYATPSATPSFSGDTSLNGNAINVETLANTIWAGEYGATTPNLFIGQSGDTYDGAPTAKQASSFATIRGLSPEEPTKQGGFYAASIALFGKTHDINPVSGEQKTDTFSVALASPLPRISFPVNTRVVTLVPFAKTVGGCGGVSAAQGAFQPTNTIVDFYVDTIKNTDATNVDASVNGGRAYAKFRINFEDSEYGSDHDMDAITEYELTALANGTVDIKLSSTYAAGSCIQHMGYVISGTTADGVYLEVRDPPDTANDVDYYLDTPNVAGPLPTTMATPRRFTPGSGGSASFVAHDPLWYAAKWGGFVDAKDPATNQGNNALDPGEWDADNDGVPDSYFLVTNAGRLKQQLTNAFAEIVSRTSSSSSVATNSTSAGSDTLIFQARFNSGDWSGQVLAFHFGADGRIGAMEWDTQNAGSIPAENRRKIFSYDPTVNNGSKGIEFCWTAGCGVAGGTTHLNDNQKRTLDLASFNANATSSPIVSYLRGNQSREKRNGSGNTFRDRSFLLGDIVNSDPIYLGGSSFGYETLPNTASERSSYASFRSTTDSRRKMLYVGANDGMLHGFDALTGVEQLAYVPNVAITSALKTLAAQGYVHRYFVDGSPAVGDAYFSDAGAWRSVLVGTTGAGGKGIFALDITDPDTFGPSNVLWEFTNGDDNDLGVAIPQASIARLANGHWGAIVANGPNSNNGSAVLFVIDIETGLQIAKIVADNANANGLFTATAVDVDNPPDRIVDYIYAGDLKGNLWKFDVTDANPASWSVANGGAPLFVTNDGGPSGGARQPITAKPVVGKVTDLTNQTTGAMVYFGAGKYYEDIDNQTPTPQPPVPRLYSFYGIWDRCDKTNSPGCIGTVTGGLSSLERQTILFEGIACLADPISGACSDVNTAAPIRITSATPANYVPTATPSNPNTNQSGWYLELSAPSNAPLERVVGAAVLRGSRVIFPTLVPSSDPCSFGGVSWLMELDAGGGNNPGSPVIDITGDEKVDVKDKVAPSGLPPTAPSGYQPPSLGIFKTPTILDCGSLECKLLSGSSGNLGVVKEGGGGGGGGLTGARRSWRQLR